MAYCNSYRNFGGLKKLYRRKFGVNYVSVRRTSKGRKKKVRRMNKAWENDGFQRKRAGGLSPVFKSSKSYLREEGY